MQSRLPDAEAGATARAGTAAGLLHRCTRTSVASWRRSGASRKPSPSFRSALKLDPNLPLARKKLGQALAALGHGAEADKAFEGWFEQDPDRVYVAIALDHLRAGRKRRGAIEPAQGAEGQIPTTSTRCIRSRSSTGATKKRLSDAEALLRASRSSRPPTSLPGRCSAGSCTTPTAPRMRSSAIGGSSELEPGNAAAWSGLGADYAQIGDMERSAEAYARSVELQPGPPGHPHEPCARAEGARPAGRSPARIPRRHRAEA